MQKQKPKKKNEQIFLQYFYPLSFSNVPEYASIVKACVPVLAGSAPPHPSLPLISVFFPGKSYKELARMQLDTHKWHTKRSRKQQ